jgi:predicted DNA-binding transcriptional regulator YafY
VTRTSTAGRLQRLELLTASLKAGEPLTIRTLAGELGVSVRTLSRDLDILREQGLPVEAERGRGGGLRLSRHWGVGRLQLTYPEAIDLLVSLAAAEQMRSPMLLANLSGIRRKLIASFSQEMSMRINSLKKRIRIGEPVAAHLLASVSAADPRAMTQLYQAFVAQEELTIAYQALGGGRTQRGIQPHYLLLCAPVWYVLAWDHLRDSTRTFRCDRILSASHHPAGQRFRLLPLSAFDAAMAGMETL